MASPISKEAKELAFKISDNEKADVYLYNGPINEDGLGSVIQAFSYKHPSAILILTTHGGSANSAYRIARAFQSIYDDFAVLIFSYCKSAGTLAAIGGHRLMMGEAAELGPLDVQLSKRDELWERRSGLLLRSALTSLNERAESLFTHLMVSIKTGSKGSVRFKLASDLAAEMTRGLFSPIYGQITPEGLGEDYQELMVAYEYGKRLAQVGGNISVGSINKLVHDYPSHDFVIDKLEARSLFNQIADPTPDMYELASKLGSLAFVPESKQVTIEALSKADEIKSDEKVNEKGASDEQPKSSTGDGTSGSSGSPAA